MRSYPLVVLKFGSSVLRNEDDLPHTVHEIYRWVRDGYRVLAVVSAFGSTTDELFAKARRFSDRADERNVAALVATGEATTAALLGLALDRAGVTSVLLDADRISLRTHGPILDSDPIAINCSEVNRLLEDYSVAIVPGFIGRDESGCLALLGRGGSDLTALFLAFQLRAQHCRLIKDVDGLFDLDPALSGRRAKRYQTITWPDALKLNADVVQRKSLRFAEHHRLAFEVSALGSNQGTLVGPAQTTFFQEDFSGQIPLRIGLLGLGTVGLGVYQSLTSQPHLFTITKVAVLHPEIHAHQVPAHLLTCDAWKVVRSECDVLIELIGGETPAKDLIAEALKLGKHVITANKRIIAEHGDELATLAGASEVELCFSAAVGGAVPMLEAVKSFGRERPIKRLRGVLNGTTTFVLDESAKGASFEEGLRAARSLGLAEADATLDVNGTDAAHKLVLLAKAAFGAELGLETISRVGIEHLDCAYVREQDAAGKVIRLVGTLQWDETGKLLAKISPQVLSKNDALSATWAERCCLTIEGYDDARVVLHGKGAGRWPTTESVMADLFDLSRRNAADVAPPNVAQLNLEEFDCAGGVL